MLILVAGEFSESEQRILFVVNVTGNTASLTLMDMTYATCGVKFRSSCNKLAWVTYHVLWVCYNLHTVLAYLETVWRLFIYLFICSVSTTGTGKVQRLYFVQLHSTREHPVRF